MSRECARKLLWARKQHSRAQLQNAEAAIHARPIVLRFHAHLEVGTSVQAHTLQKNKYEHLSFTICRHPYGPQSPTLAQAATSRVRRESAVHAQSARGLAVWHLKRFLCCSAWRGLAQLQRERAHRFLLADVQVQGAEWKQKGVVLRIWPLDPTAKQPGYDRVLARNARAKIWRELRR